LDKDNLAYSAIDAEGDISVDGTASITGNFVSYSTDFGSTATGENLLLCYF
jgi:hypothetical protein